MKVISFSLWGNRKLYTIGAIKNADLALTLYPDWMCYFYCNSCVPENIINELKNKPNTKVIEIPGPGNNTCRLNRFLVTDDENVEYMVSRDVDSRLSIREKIAVDEWINCNTDIHLMRDHLGHGAFVMAGMHGLKTSKFKGRIKSTVQHFLNTVNTDNPQQDQIFLSNFLKNEIDNNNATYTIHDPFYNRIKFPIQCKRGKENGGVYFVGQQVNVDENNNDIYSVTSEEIEMFNSYN